MAAVVRAAGGVVWRMQGNTVEVLLVHRPQRADWSFPKGKVAAGDVDEAHTALREVLEETGYRCALGRELSTITYRDQRDRSKQVRYWEMQVVSGRFEPNDEVDEIRWLAIDGARELLTHALDRGVLDTFAVFAGAA